MQAEFPDQLEFLFQPARYKVLWGGRGGAKSWGVARALLLIGAQRPIRVLCARELQSSISDSVHKLLSDQIVGMGLSDTYTIEKMCIFSTNGTEFSFAGIRHNVGSIKSFEGVDICWVEEAQNVSKTSWETLIPTIRKDGSEIWITFNPELDTDETYRRFIKSQPPEAIIRKINWRDNPWFPRALELERNHMEQNDPDAYLNVWEGNTRHVLEGAIYASELRNATIAGRITKVSYDATKPVHTFWDLGWSDHTSIWMAQIIGWEYRIIDYLQDRHKTVEHFLKVLQSKGYLYGTDYLPHDGNKGQLASGGKTIRDLMVAAGRRVNIVPNLRIEDGINIARTLFNNCWFDEDRCSDGLQSLRHYRYDVDPQTRQYSRNPLHNESSHGADAFRYLAIALKEYKAPGAIKRDKARRTFTYDQGQTENVGWMS